MPVTIVEKSIGTSLTDVLGVVSVQNGQEFSIEILNLGPGNITASDFKATKNVGVLGLRTVEPVFYDPSSKAKLDVLIAGQRAVMRIDVADFRLLTLELSASVISKINCEYDIEQRIAPHLPKTATGDLAANFSGSISIGAVTIKDPITGDQQNVSPAGAAKIEEAYAEDVVIFCSGLVTDAFSTPVTGAGKYKGGFHIAIDGTVAGAGGSGLGKITMQFRVRGRSWTDDDVYVYTIPAGAGAFSQTWFVSDRFDEMRISFSGIPGANLVAGLNCNGIGFKV